MVSVTDENVSKSKLRKIYGPTKDENLWWMKENEELKKIYNAPDADI